MQGEDFGCIVNVVNLYAAALDAHRYELFDDVFTEDVVIDFGGGAAWTDRASLAAGFRAIHAVFSATQHMVSGHSIKLGSHGGACLSYVHARFMRPIEGNPGIFDSTGWYDDTLVRTKVGWRIKSRVSRMVSTSGDYRVMQAMPGVDTNFKLLSLAGEAEAGRVAFFGAVG